MKNKIKRINSKIPSFLEPFRELRLQGTEVAGNLKMGRLQPPREMGRLRAVPPMINRSPHAEETVREDGVEETFEEIMTEILQNKKDPGSSENLMQNRN